MNIKNILFVSHYRCNFNCSYCNQREFNIKEELNPNDCFPFLQYLNEHNECKDIGFQFEGGETLIRWKTFIVPIVNFIKEKTEINPSYSLFTNGTIYTNELFNFLQENNFKVIVSIDGNEKVFTKQRNKKMFSIVQKNLHQFLQLSNTKVNAVFTAETIKDLFDSYLFFVDNGVKELSITPNNNIKAIWTDTDLKNIKLQFLKILEADKKNHILVAQNALWNSSISTKQKIENHHCNLRIFPNKKISFSSDPFLKNEKKSENCTLDNFHSLFLENDNNFDNDDILLINTEEACNKCLSKFLCPRPEVSSNKIQTSPTLCAMRVAYLMNEQLENYV